MGKAVWAFAFFTALLFGYWAGKPALKRAAENKVHPEKDFPVSERKSFAFIVYGRNQEKWCERSLRSIFEQEYDYYRVIFIDDASSDNTFSSAKDFILENNQDHRVILMRNEERLGRVACLYRAIDGLLDKEIAIPLDAKDWLSNSGVLTKLNSVYQNPDVWTAQAEGLSYPALEKSAKGLDTFYSAIFKEIPLKDLFQKGKFGETAASYMEPIRSLSGGRVRKISDPLVISNETRPGKPAIDPFAPAMLDSLAEFPKPKLEKERADVVLFSFDRPMQLFACLESVHRYMGGIGTLSVIYRASDERFASGYDQVKKAFPNARFIRQSEDPKRDFKPNTMQAVFGAPSKYVLFGVDDIVVKDLVDLSACAEKMEKTGAYGFYLRFGKHIRFCYQSGKPQAVPPSIPLGQDVFVWDIQTGEGDWGFPNSVDMTLFRKADLKEAFEKMKFKTPNSLEFIWATEHAPKQALGLYFAQSKIVNIPLNVVGKTGNPHMDYSSTEDLLAKFNEGLKFDIEPLHGIENRSPHFEYTPELVYR